MISGPLHWGDDYHTCVGKHQSPINIEEHDVRFASYPPLGFSGLYVPRTTQITNNGHTGTVFSPNILKIFKFTHNIVKCNFNCQLQNLRRFKKLII